MPAGAADAYEELRSAWLNPLRPPGSVSGRAMLLRHGMLAWAQGWGLTPAGAPTPCARPGAAGAPRSSDITSELVQLMAGLILRHSEGVGTYV